MILNQQHEVRVAMRPLESFLRRVKRELGLKQSDVTVCLVSDKAMARLNENFRKKKGPTDVLSFPQGNSYSPLATRHCEGGKRERPRTSGSNHGWRIQEPSIWEILRSPLQPRGAMLEKTAASSLASFAC